MTEYTQISELIVGPTELFVEAWHKPQHNEHTKGWRFHMFLQDCDKRDAAVRAWVKEMKDDRERRAAELRQAAQILEAAE